MGAHDDEEREFDELGDEDSFDGPAFEELEADLIEEWCPVCRDIKPHAPTSGDKIACAVCNHEHRREIEVPTQAAVPSLLTPEDEVSDEARHRAWERLTNVPDSEIQAYSIRLKLAAGDVIRHAKFGVGIVIELSDVTKAKVLFSDGSRLLVCGK